MNWTRFGLTVLVAGIGTSLTDWLFMGVLFHEKYRAHPEVWRRPEGGAGETRAIVLALALGLLSCAAFVFLSVRLGLTSHNHALKLAAAVWTVGPLPIIGMNALWMKYHPLIVLSHSLGWLARLVVSALAVAWLMG